MTAEEHEIRQERFRRIRMVKRLLRPLPRRATLHRYPVLKWFRKMALKRSYLWSFRAREVVPALYAGWILSLLPIYGIQFGVAFFLAIVLRANVMLLVGLQLVTNPITVVPIYAACYAVGDVVLQSIWSMIDSEAVLRASQETVVHSSAVREGLQRGARFMAAASLGGVVIGYFAGFISSLIYQYAAKRASRSYQDLLRRSRDLAEKRKVAAAEKSATPDSPSDAPTTLPPGSVKRNPSTG